MICCIIAAIVLTAPGEPAVTETRLPTGDSLIRVTDASGRVRATYKVLLAKHHSPATNPDDPLIRQWLAWKFGAFVCFNSNQYTGLEFCRLRDPQGYNPPVLDVKQWVATFKAAGMTHAILTVRHTSGFLLWDSPTSTHDVARSGNKTDLAGAFVRECRRQGLHGGFYYCLWGGKACSVTGRKELPHARATILAQLHELATRYGAIPYFWIDMKNWAPANLSTQEIYDALKNVNPKSVVIFNQHIQDGRALRYFPTDLVNGEIKLPPPAGHEPRRKVGPTTYYLPFEYEPCSQARPKSGSKGEYGRYCWFTYGPGKRFEPSKPFPVATLYRYIQLARRRGASNVLLACAPDHSGRLRDADVRQLIALGRMLEDPSLAPPPPLTLGGKATASGVWPDPRLPARLAFDGDPGTRWGGAPDTKAGWLAVDLGKPRTFQRVWISEGWDRIRRFELQIRQGEKWVTVHRGTTVGVDYSATLKPVTARHVRLNILEATDVPTIWEVQLFAPK